MSARKHSKTGKRRCTKCGNLKPRAEFNRQRDKPDGVSYRCKVCERSRRMKYFDRDRGFEPGEVEATIARLNGVCESCGRPETRTRGGVVTRLMIDHDHRTSKVRGFLCSRCNSALGLLQDDPLRIRALAAYVERFQGG